MRFRDILDLTLGVFRLPQRAAPGNNGDAVLDTNRVRLKGTAGQGFYLLSDLDFGEPGGVPQLDGDGLIPTDTLPSSGVTGFDIGDVKWICRANPVDIPANTLPCDGRAVLRILYPVLFGRIGASCGSPSDDATFRLPQLMDRGVLGAPGGNAATYGLVRRVAVRDHGAGFTPGNHLVTVQGGAFLVPAQIRVVVLGSGAVGSATIVSPGSYTDIGAAVVGSNCALTLASGIPGGGTGLHVEFYLSGVGATGWYVYPTNGGTGYVNAPEITFGGSLVGASAVAEIEQGRIIRVTVTDWGNYDLSAPTVSVSGGGGSGAVLVFHSAGGQGAMGASRGEDAHYPTVAETAEHQHTFPLAAPAVTGVAAAYSVAASGAPTQYGTSGVYAPGVAVNARHNTVGPSFYLIPVIRVL